MTNRTTHEGGAQPTHVIEMQPWWWWWWLWCVCVGGGGGEREGGEGRRDWERVIPLGVPGILLSLLPRVLLLSQGSPLLFPLPSLPVPLPCSPDGLPSPSPLPKSALPPPFPAGPPSCLSCLSCSSRFSRFSSFSDQSLVIGFRLVNDEERHPPLACGHCGLKLVTVTDLFLVVMSFFDNVMCDLQRRNRRSAERVSVTRSRPLRSSCSVLCLTSPNFTTSASGRPSRRSSLPRCAFSSRRPFQRWLRALLVWCLHLEPSLSRDGAPGFRGGLVVVLYPRRRAQQRRPWTTSLAQNLSCSGTIGPCSLST